MQDKKAIGILFLACLVGLTGPVLGQVFQVKLDGAQQVPANDSEATGLCLGYLDQGEGTFTIICSHNVENAIAAHIHRALPGESGPVHFPFDSPASPFKGQFEFSAADIEDLLAGELYVNIHSEAFQGGEIRGQIGPPMDAAVAFPLTGEEDGNETDRTGTCMAALNPLNTVFSIACTHDVADVTAAHIHRGAPGVAGPVVFGFGASTTIIDQVSWDDFPGCPDFDSFLADLNAGLLYVNVHNPAEPGGLIRGQIPPPPGALYFPQFGNGGGFSSAITLTNTSTTTEVAGVLYFQDVDGGPLTVGLAGGGLVGTQRGGTRFQVINVSEVDFEIPPLGSVSITTDGQGDIALGSAKAVANGPIGGIIRFSIPSIGIAGFGSAPPLDRALVPVRAAGSLRTAIAVRNNESHPITVNFALQGVEGDPEDLVAERTIPANGRVALFMDELFENLAPGDFQGTLLVSTGEGSFSAISLELGPNPGEFTSLPVSPVVGP